jgi:hypothetical protein
MQKTCGKILIAFFLILIQHSFAQDFKWARNPKGDDFDKANDLITDVNGISYIGGYFRSTYLDFGGITLYNSAGFDTFGTPCYDAFVAKYDSNSALIFAKRFGMQNFQESIEGVAFDHDGNTYITGWYTSTSFQLDTVTLTNSGGWDYFIAKLDTGGNVIWARKANGTSDDMGTALTVDPLGNVIATGYYWSSPFILGTNTLANSGSCDAFIVKYDTDGNLIWAKKAGGNGIDLGNGISTDPSGNIYLTGQYSSSSFSFGNHTLSNSGSSDVFSVKYSPGGNDMWAVKGSGSKMDHSWDISVLGYKGFAITGAFMSPSMTFGSTVVNNSQQNTFDIFVVRYDSSGTVLWAKKAGMGGLDDIGWGVSMDTLGNVYVVGDFISPNLTFGGTPFVNNTDTSGTFSDIFVASFDSTGNPRWMKNGRDKYNDNCYAVSNDHLGNTFITGTFEGANLGLDLMVLGNTGATDFFIAKIGPYTPLPLQIEEMPKANFILYPNPASDIISLKLEDDQLIISLNIADCSGRIIRSFATSVTGKEYNIDLSGLAKGVYSIIVITAQDALNSKFIIR